jgi:transketolase
MKKIIKQIRKNIIHLANLSKSPHVASALSCADIIATLYFKILKLEPFEKRDIFILSKAHSAMALYSTLYEKKLLTKKEFESYYQNGGVLPAHTDKKSNKYIEISAGSLGHGLPIGIGMAYSMKLKKEKRKVFVLMGDGESQEGSVWESAMIAPKLNLDNLVVFIDRNNLQGYGRADELLSYEPIDDKFKAFNWEVIRIDGHNVNEIIKAVKVKTDKPKMVILDTIKGKGVNFMEDKLIWHYYIVTDEIKREALKVLDELKRSGKKIKKSHSYIIKYKLFTSAYSLFRPYPDDLMEEGTLYDTVKAGKWREEFKELSWYLKEILGKEKSKILTFALKDGREIMGIFEKYRSTSNPFSYRLFNPDNPKEGITVFKHAIDDLWEN